MKVWVIIEASGCCDAGVVGVCSSEERAKIAVECVDRYRFTQCTVESYEIDEILTDAMRSVRNDLESYKEALALLDRLTKIEKEEGSE